MKKNIIRILNTMLISFLVLFLIIIGLTPVHADYDRRQGSETDHGYVRTDKFEIRNKELYNQYIDLCDHKGNIASSDVKRNKFKKEGENAFDELILPLDASVYVSSKDKNELIIYDKINDLYIYAEINNMEEGLLIEIKGTRFLLSNDPTNVYIEFVNESKYSLLEIELDEKEYYCFTKQLSKDLRGYWVYTNYGIHYGSTTGTVSAVYSISAILITVIGYFTGLPGLTFASIAISAAAGSYNVGDSITCYIEYDSAYMSDCPTYVRQDIRVRQDSYTGTIDKAYTRTFHTVRPEYSLPACIAY